jgi:Mrp family chromosome partitioning ATPase
LAERLGLAAGPGLTDHLTAGAPPADVLQTFAFEPSGGTNGAGPRPVADAIDGLPAVQVACIVAGSPTTQPAELLESARWLRFLEEVREAYDVVVIDSSPLLPVGDTRGLLPHVDGVLVCLRASQTTRGQAHAARAALEHFPKQPTGVVITGMRAGEEQDYGYYSYSYAGGPGERRS